MSRVIYISNSANQEFQALVTPRSSVLWADLWSIKAVDAWGELKENLKTPECFYNWYKSAGLSVWSPEEAKIISYFFDNFSTRISAGESKEIFNSARSRDYFNSHHWEKINQDSQWLIFLRSKDGKWISAFNSYVDYAWITQGRGQSYEAIGARPGKVWHADPSAGQHGFFQVQTKN